MQGLSIDLGIGVGKLLTPTEGGGVPDAFTAGMWTATANDQGIRVDPGTLPSLNGGTLQDIEYRVDGGSAQSSGLADPADWSDPFDIVGLTNGVEYDVEIRLVTQFGAGEWSDVKAVTPAASWYPTDDSTPILILDASELSTLFQNVAGSTAVTADSDPVGAWNDISSNNFDFVAPGDNTTRPLYHTAGGLHWVEGDGSNDLLYRAAALFAMSGAVTLGFALRVNTSSFGALFGLGSSANNSPAHVYRAASTATTLENFYRNQSETTSDFGGLAAPNALDDTDNVVVITYNNGAGEIFVDGVSIDTLSHTTSGTYSFDRTALFGFLRYSASSWLSGRIYAAVAKSAVVGATERANLTTWLASKQGRSL